MSNRISIIQRGLKRNILVLFFMLLSLNLFSQQSSLTVNASSTESEPATGYFILTDNAIQDSTWKVLLNSGTAYFPFYTVGIDGIDYNKSISVYPNPVGSYTDAKINIGANYQLKFMRIYNYTGKLLYMQEPPIDEFQLKSGSGLLLMQFQDKEGLITTKKLISTVDILNFKVLSDNDVLNNKPNNEISKNKSLLTNSYTLTFEDLLPSDPEFDDYSEQISIDDTEHKVLDITLEYTLKNIIIEGITSPEITGIVKTGTDELGSLISDGDGIISQTSFQYAFSKNKTLPITIELNDNNADTINLEKDAEHNQVIHIDTLLTYNCILSGTSCSPIGAQVEIYDNDILIGSDVISGAGEYQIEWSSQHSSLEIDSIVVTKVGYDTIVEKNKVLNAGSNIFNVNLIVVTYDFNLSGSSCSPVGAQVEIYDNDLLIGSDVISSDSTYQITWSSQNSSLEIDSVVVSMDGYYTKVEKNMILNAGSNIFNVSLDVITYHYILYVNANIGASVTIKSVLNQEILRTYTSTGQEGLDTTLIYGEDSLQIEIHAELDGKQDFDTTLYIIEGLSNTISFNMEDVLPDYVRVWGNVTNPVGTSIIDIDVKFSRVDNPSEVFQATTFYDGMSIWYDFGNTIPVYTNPENYDVELIVEDGRGLIFTTHSTTIPVQSPWVQRNFVIDSLPWQKIQGTIRDCDSIEYKLEGVTVKFYDTTNYSAPIDTVLTDINGYYKSNIAFEPNTVIKMIIGGKQGYYSRGLFWNSNVVWRDWVYTVPHPMFAADTIATYNWTLPRVVGKYGLGVNDTITVLSWQISMMVKNQNIEHAMKRGALFNYEQFIADSPSQTSEDVDNFIAYFKDAFPAADIRRTTSDYVLTTQQKIDYDYQTNYYPDSVITHVTQGINQTSYEYTTIDGLLQILYSKLLGLSGSMDGYRKETGRAIGFGEVSYESFMDNDGGPITNRDKRVGNLILKQGQYRYYYGYDSWSYKNLKEDIDDKF